MSAVLPGKGGDDRGEDEEGDEIDIFVFASRRQQEGDASEVRFNDDDSITPSDGRAVGGRAGVGGRWRGEEIDELHRVFVSVVSGVGATPAPSDATADESEPGTRAEAAAAELLVTEGKAIGTKGRKRRCEKYSSP
jgi:hypothetical protein